MVKPSALLLISLIASAAMAETPAPTAESATTATAAPALASRVKLSHKEIPAMVLEKSDRTREMNLLSEFPRLTLAATMSTFDWIMQAQTGFEKNRFESLSGYGNIEDQILSSTVSLQKMWITGTLTSVDWNRKSYRTQYSPLSPGFSTQPAEQTQDIFGLRLEQSLWGNSFGYSSRRKVKAAGLDFSAATVTRAKNLQNLVLLGLSNFWLSYISQENVKQAIRSVDRYERLVATVRRKSSFGYSAPGELNQAQAELEMKKQLLKANSQKFLNENENLLLFLGLNTSQEIEFVTDVQVTAPPRLPPIEITNLRAYKAQAMTLESANLRKEASVSDSNPNLSLVGQVFGSGLEEKASESMGEALSGSRPKYYVGIKFETSFGSGYQAEDRINKTVSAELEKIRLDRLKQQIEIDLLNAERDAKVKYANVLSTSEQLALRIKAMNEIDKAYTQGRVDIKNVIDAMNSLFDIEVAHGLAIGTYQIALAEWASIRDELIPDQKTE